MKISTSQLEGITQLIYDVHGLDFSGYAKESLGRRFLRLMRVKEWKTLYQLRYGIINNEISPSELLNEITVNVTEMFRDPPFYNAIRKLIVPYLNTFPMFKIWHAGCATGEEMYSTAIVLHELGILNRSVQYGTDVNSAAIERASQGIYNANHMKKYTSNYLKSGGNATLSEYYIARYGNAKMNDELKKNMVFSRHNLAQEGSFNEFQLICCRNVMIYFDDGLKNHVFELLLESLVPYGYLVLGSNETMVHTPFMDRVEVVDSENRIFRKKGIPGRVRRNIDVEVSVNNVLGGT